MMIKKDEKMKITNYHITMLLQNFNCFIVPPPGAWVCFSQVDILRPEVMGTLSQMLLGIMSALRAKQSSVSFFGAEYHLDHNGSCFATIDSRIKISSSDPKKPLCIPAAATRLPQSFLTLFRAASFVAPSTRMVLETILISKGYNWFSKIFFI